MILNNIMEYIGIFGLMFIFGLKVLPHGQFWGLTFLTFSAFWVWPYVPA